MRRFLSGPNLMSLSRIPMAAALWWTPPNTAWLLGWMAAAAVSDWMDGAWARRLKQIHPDPEHAAAVEETGAWLDPVCDKVFVFSLLCLMVTTLNVTFSAMVLLGLRDVLVFSMTVLWAVLGGPSRLRVPFRARPLGKATTVLQFSAVISVLVWRDVFEGITLLCAVVGLMASADYAWRAWRHSQATSNEESP